MLLSVQNCHGLSGRRLLSLFAYTGFAASGEGGKLVASDKAPAVQERLSGRVDAADAALGLHVGEVRVPQLPHGARLSRGHLVAATVPPVDAVPTAVVQAAEHTAMLGGKAGALRKAPPSALAAVEEPLPVHYVLPVRK